MFWGKECLQYFVPSQAIIQALKPLLFKSPGNRVPFKIHAMKRWVKSPPGSESKPQFFQQFTRSCTFWFPYPFLPFSPVPDPLPQALQPGSPPSRSPDTSITPLALHQCPHLCGSSPPVWKPCYCTCLERPSSPSYLDFPYPQHLLWLFSAWPFSLALFTIKLTLFPLCILLLIYLPQLE